MFVNHDYDLTVVLHVEARDIGNYANPEYYWLYDSPEVQELLAQAKASPDPDEFVELRRQAARLIAEEAPAVWLLLYNDVTVARGNLGLPDVRRQRPLRRLRHRRGELTAPAAIRPGAAGTEPDRLGTLLWRGSWSGDSACWCSPCWSPASSCSPCGWPR